MPLSQPYILDLSDRWQVYHRLQELEIPCSYSTGQPLKVSVTSPTAALQVWSVTRSQQQSRHHLAQWLNQCLTTVL